MKKKKIGLLIIRLIIVFILVQTLWFKFTAAPESVALFSKIGMEPNGRIITGIFELIASTLILLSGACIALGALLAAGLMSGAIFFHLTILGVTVDGDPSLFIMAVIAFLFSLVVLYIYRTRIPILGKHIKF